MGSLVMLGLGTSPETQSSSELLSMAIAAESSGLLLRLSMVVRFSKRYLYLNLMYGNKLFTFLRMADESSGTVRESPSDQIHRMTVSYRARLSEYKVLLSSDKHFLWKMVLYFVSWTIKLLADVVVCLQPRVGKQMLILLYFIPKIHLIVFNMIFFDFSFYFTRSFLHSHNMDSTWIMSRLLLLLLSLDMLGMYLSVIDIDGWRYVFKQRKRISIENEVLLEAAANAGRGAQVSQEIFKREVEKRLKRALHSNPAESSSPLNNLNEVSNLGLPNESDFSSQKLQDTPVKTAQTQLTTIDYRHAYKHIAMNMHVIQPMAEPLSLDISSYMHASARSSSLVSVARVCIFNAVVVSSQTASIFAICILLLLELTRLSISTSLYIRKRHYKHILLYIMEMNGIFMTCFLLSILVFYAERPVNQSTTLKDDVCIWMIIIQCCNEYLLTLSYICYAVYSTIKIRRQTRGVDHYREKRSMFGFIKMMSMDVKSEEKPSVPLTIKPPKSNFVRNRVRPIRRKLAAANPQDVQMANDLPAARKVNPTLVDALNKNNRKLKRVTVDSTSKNNSQQHEYRMNFSNQIENTKPISESINEKKEKTVKQSVDE